MNVLLNLTCFVLLIRHKLCDEQIVDNHAKEKYLSQNNKPEWNKFYELIGEAENNYKECEFNETNSCQCFLDFLISDFKPFESAGITKQNVEKAKQLNLGVHYQIIGHKLYRQKECMFPSRCDGVEHFILKTIKEVPDMDLIINVRDYPQTYRTQLLPVLSFSKDDRMNNDITYPAWAFWSGGPAIDHYPTGIGRWDLMREHITKFHQNWASKKSIAFFRGSRTSAERDPLVLLSRKKPKLVDAKYTKNQAWRSPADTLGDEPAKTIPFEDQCQYKYLFNFRGVAASFRYKHLFLCKSLVLNVESNWIEFIYGELKPWIHFVPVTLNNMQDVIEFLKENDDIARRIAKRGFEFIWQNLTNESVECYWKNLLLKYAQLINYQPERDPTLQPVRVK